jgi:hypothetical protein
MARKWLRKIDYNTEPSEALCRMHGYLQRQKTSDKNSSVMSKRELHSTRHAPS